MNRNLSKKDKITATFIALLLMATFIASLLPQATATPTTPTINPESGPIGTTVKVIGEIDTENGSYQIRWDGENVSDGNATGITVDDMFIVPPSTEGNHNVTLYDVDNNTESLPRTFTVYKLYCQIQTVNLANETLADILVEVYNATTEDLLNSNLTDTTGWAVFPLDPGNYSFKAFWKDVEVGVLHGQVIDENKTLTLKCQLINVEVVVKDEAGAPLPLINVTMIYNRTTRYNTTITEPISSETNNTGTIKLTNMFTHVNYTLETRRYGFVFNTTFIKELPAQPRYNITCPTYTTSVKVLDSKGGPLSNVQVNLMEWSSWSSADSGTTDNQGNVNFSTTFGRYKVKVYNYSAVLGHEVVLNETMFDLIEDGLSVIIHSKISNVDLSVGAIDYFGQPVPNAMVEIERKVEQEWIKIDSSTTGLDGLVSLNINVGGDCRVSVYVTGKLAGIKQLYLDESKQILFKIDNYTVIGGYPVETIQLITYALIVLLVVTFSLALTYRRLLRRFLKKKSESEE